MMDDDLDLVAKKKEFEKFKQAIGSENDPTMLVLRAHLFSENLLERLITFNLPRGDKVIESGNLSYHQKLVLIEALDRLPDSIISTLRNLNKLRNQCAHELDKKITDGDITRIGSPLGKEFTRFKREAKFEESVLLRKVIDYVSGYLTANCHLSEHPDTLKRPHSEKEAIPKTTRSKKANKGNAQKQS
jgi:hypothetical protein